jgi:hypothetical protein
MQSEVGAAHKGLRTAQEALNVATREAVSLQVGVLVSICLHVLGLAA